MYMHTDSRNARHSSLLKAFLLNVRADEKETRSWNKTTSY